MIILELFRRVGSDVFLLIFRHLEKKVPGPHLRYGQNWKLCHKDILIDRGRGSTEAGPCLTSPTFNFEGGLTKFKVKVNIISSRFVILG